VTRLGELFAHWVFVYFGKFLKIAEVPNIFGMFFSTVKFMHLFCQKMVWATLWATLSPTHLVTLPVGHAIVLD
jgi:hypothetical protein